MNRILYAWAVLLPLGAPAAMAADPGPIGMWLAESGRGAVDIQPCGDKLCGSLAWLKAPLNEQGKPKTDIHNPDPALQQRPLCGVPILAGFAADGPNSWSGGTIYDAASGTTYKSTMALNPDGTLHVRGYVGISLFGKSQVWTRPATAPEHCK